MHNKMCAIFSVYIIGLIDLMVAFVLIGVASFQFAKGASLMDGPRSDSEKLTRLVCYACIIYIFLIIQVIMAIKLYRSARKMTERPIFAIKVFRWWREWSVVLLMALLLHAMVVLMLMDNGQRKTVCLVSTIAHVTLRPFGILIIGKFKESLESELPTKLSTEVS